MSPIIFLTLCALLSGVLSVDLEKIKQDIEELEQKVKEDKAAIRKVEHQLKGQSGVYKDVFDGMIKLKKDLSNATKDTIEILINATREFNTLKAATIHEREEIKQLSLVLKKLLLAQKLLTQDINLFEQRKLDGDENSCFELEAQKQLKLSSRYLKSEDEGLILLEELKLAEIAAFEFAERRQILESKLKQAQVFWEQDLKSVYEVVQKYEANLNQLKSKVEVKNKEIDEEKQILLELVKEKVDLKVKIRQADVKYRDEIKLIKNFQPAAVCYLDLRVNTAKTN